MGGSVGIVHESQSRGEGGSQPHTGHNLLVTQPCFHQPTGPHTGPHMLDPTFWASHTGLHTLDSTYWASHTGPHILGLTYCASHTRPHILGLTKWSHKLGLTYRALHTGPHILDTTYLAPHRSKHHQDIRIQQVRSSLAARGMVFFLQIIASD